MIDERELTVTVRRHHPGGLTRSSGDLIDRLTDHFLKVTSFGIGWVHPSWRALVIDELRDDAAARQRFLTACRVDGVMLALSHATDPDERTQTIAQTLLTRIPSLIDQLHEMARHAMGVAGRRGGLDQQRWWVPHDISAPPSRERVAEPKDFTRKDVRRVLNGL